MREGKPAGAMTMREGLVHSRNMVAIQLGLRVGMDSVAALSQRLGINTPMDPGAGERDRRICRSSDRAGRRVHRVREQRRRRSSRAFISRIDDLAGRTVFARPPSTPQQVLDPRVAFIMRDIMKDVAERGSGTQARKAVPDGVPVAGKTGTTNDNVDVWFVGMTPELVAGVWLGFDRPKTIASGAVGGGLAAPIWGQMIGRYYASHSTTGWGPPPDGLVLRGARSRRRVCSRRHSRLAGPAIHRVFPSGYGAGGAAEQSVEGAAVGSALHAARSSP